MKVLWLNWKDMGHPGAGGAEVVMWQLSRRLVAEGHEVTLLTCGYQGASSQEMVDGVQVVRVGTNRYVHSAQALAHYVRRMRNRFDVVIEVVNTAPYFGVFFGRQSKRYLFYHQLAREIWFHETKPPLSHVGHYALEPFATRVLSKAGVPVITVSDSTKQDLLDYGFSEDRMHIISEGIEMEPLQDLASVTKFDKPTLLSLGAMRAMKRTLHQVEAFEIAKKHLPDLQLKIAGSSSDEYGKQVLARIADSPFKADIEYCGRVSPEQKVELMRRCHAVLFTSIREGWGLVVTEAASQGTPAVVYDVPGLRDSVRDGKTGIVTAANQAALADGIEELLEDSERYQRIRRAAWEWSKEITFDRSYSDFKAVLEIV